jgi:hypothetical protein
VPYTDSIQDWITQHDIFPEADKKAKELLTHFEIHKLDIFQRKHTHRRAGLLLTEAGAQEVGKGRTSAARRHRKRSNRGTNNCTTYKRTTRVTLPPDPESHLRIKKLTHELRGTRKAMRKGTRIGQNDRVEGPGEGSEQDMIEGNRQINTNSRLLKNLEDHYKVHDDGLLNIQIESELERLYLEPSISSWSPPKDPRAPTVPRRYASAGAGSS